MRIAFLGMNGPLSIEALSAAARDHEVVAIARPAEKASGSGLPIRLRRAASALLRRGNRSLDGMARQLGLQVTSLRGGSDPSLLEMLWESRPDLLCVASFPWLLPAAALGLPPLGAVNVHAALLPRHRGLLPLFWIYHADDRETGVTIHRMSEQADTGDILFQSSFPLPRGQHVDVLNLRNAEATGPLVSRALAAIAAGNPPRIVQDESRATTAPFVRAGTPMVDFENWGAERVWHFLTGLFPRFIEPLHDTQGLVVQYRGVGGFSIEPHARLAGTVERTGKGARLFCRDGWIQLDA